MLASWSANKRLMRLDKPIGIYLLLWPTCWALLVAAQGWPGWHISIVFLLGVICMRSAGCVINDYADRHVDGKVTRTAQRPMVSGEVSENQALTLFALLVAIAFALALTLDINTILLSIVALGLATLYPFMKRVTYLPQFILGAAFSWAIPMAFMAVSGILPSEVWILYATNLCWTVAYDTQYAMVDREDDLRAGIKSTAILFGHYDRLCIGVLQLVTIGLFLILINLLALSWLVVSGVALMVCLFAYQQWLIRDAEPAQCFKAFLNNHYAGMIMAVCLGLEYLI
jgi:4-hydroxybenzoate polyprenyltransferase